MLTSDEIQQVITALHDNPRSHYIIHNGIDAPFIDKSNLNQILPSQSGNAGKFLTTDGTNIFFGSIVIPSKFGGTGADGDLTITSGSFQIDLGGAAVVIKNWSSISITGTGNVTFINANAAGTNIIFLCLGNYTNTSSSSHGIDLRGLGGKGGNGNNGNTQSANVVATPGTENTDDGITIIFPNKFGNGSTGTSGGGTANTGGGGASLYTTGTAGTGATGNNGKAGTALSGLTLYLEGAQPYLGIRGFCIAGAGGGGGNQAQGIGGNSFGTAINGSGGALGTPNGGNGANDTGSLTYSFGGSGGGGAGGGGFYMEVAETFNFTGTIDCSGGTGGNGGNKSGSAANGFGGSGGGGGSGGTFITYYNILIANSGSVSVTGGTGGTAGTGTTGNGNNGGSGGNGFSYIGINQWFT